MFKKSIWILSFVAFTSFSSWTMADEHSAINPADIRDFINTVFKDNADYVNKVTREKLDEIKDAQFPRATVVSCSDSRVQSDAYHASPSNDLFFIRNIGNQIASNLGSVEYGIDHLHTPILLIIGHSHCGAIEAAMGDYSTVSPAIRQELDSLRLPKSTNANEGVIENVNKQVAFAMKQFKDKIDKKELIVLGTVYDFRDDFNRGHGRLILINLNGETQPEQLKQNPLLKNIDLKAIGVR